MTENELDEPGYATELRNPFRLHYLKLVGRRITGVVVDQSPKEDGEEPIWGLELDGRDVAWILSDPAGNGPGFLNVEPRS
jgi:hypothetical protein